MTLLHRIGTRLRRPQGVPWRSAGLRTESLSADESVRSTGWVFDNKTGEVSLESFTAGGDNEVRRYLKLFGFTDDSTRTLSMVEIGSGIGRMTAGFSKRFAMVYAADVDAAFLERCRETVFHHGTPPALRTVHVADGRSLDVATGSVDFAFSYITLQHCGTDDALSLVSEALRVTKTGGQVALNFRTWTVLDTALVPLGGLVRVLWRIPKAAKHMARIRALTRLGWQANRLSPDDVLASIGIDLIGTRLRDVTIVHSPRRRVRVSAEGVRRLAVRRVHPSHWWLVARLA
ncbi:MAG: class I SAM-dependent methyltransferase [Ilumatobacteraceae bacterium]